MDNLSGHDVIGYDESLSATPGPQWLLDHAGSATFVMRANSIVAAVNATIVGMGIGLLPCFLGAQPGLRRLTPRTIGERDVTLVVHPDLSRVARVRGDAVVMDFIVEMLARDASLWDGTRALPD